MHGMATPKLNTDYERRPYWHSTMPAIHSRAGRQLPDAVDVAIVGGGYTGVAAARKLALQGAKAVLFDEMGLARAAARKESPLAGR